MDVRPGLAAGAALLLAACGVGSTPTAGDPAAPSAAPTAAGVVPWADLPAAHERIPTTRVPASPDPAAAETASSCTASQLRLKYDGVDGGMNHDYYRYDLRLARGPACSVSGSPGVSFLDHGQPVAIPTEHADSTGFTYGHPVLVSGNATATLEVVTINLWCAAPLHVDTVRLSIGGGFVDGPGFGRTPLCMDPGSNAGPSTYDIGTLYPTDFRPARRASAWDDVVIPHDHGLDLRSTPGQPMDFTITLLADHDVPLDPCPDYRLITANTAPPVAADHQLNCAAVPYIRDGVPYLPAGTPVTFTMRVTAPTRLSKVAWSLILPTRAIASGGIYRPSAR